MNPYEILGIPPDSDESEIKSAYRGLVRIYHPDVNASANAATKFIYVQLAYEALRDGKDLKETLARSMSVANLVGAWIPESEEFDASGVPRILIKATAKFDYSGSLVMYGSTFRTAPKIGDVKTLVDIQRYHWGLGDISESALWGAGVQFRISREHPFRGGATIVVLAQRSDTSFLTLGVHQTA